MDFMKTKEDLMYFANKFDV